MNGKRVIIVDKYIVSWSGHWMQYAVDLAELCAERGAQVSIVVNKLFGRGAFKQGAGEIEKLSFKPKLYRALHQPAFYKKRHPYEKLKKKKPSLIKKVQNWFIKPGSVRPVIYFAAADYRSGNFKSPLQLLSFFTRYANPIALVSGVAAATVGGVIWVAAKSAPGRFITNILTKVDGRLTKISERSQARIESANSLMNRFKVLRKQISGYRAMFAKVDPGEDDLILFQTAEQSDLLALARVVQGHAKWRRAHYKLILRTPVWDRDGNVVEPPEEAKLLRSTLLELMQGIERLELFVDTEEMVDQYRALGFQDVNLVPILYGREVSEQFDAVATMEAPPHDGRTLSVVRSGSAQREKGFLVLPDLVKAAQIERAKSGIDLRFIIQATMLRFQPRWDRLVETVNRLRWFSDGDVELITKEVSTEDYVKTLVRSDIVLSPNRSVPYMHGSTGTTIEALRAGKPLVSLSENWGSRQVRNLDLFVNHLDAFATSTEFFRLGDADLTSDQWAFEGDWMDLPGTWAPFCQIEPWQLSSDIARRIDVQVPPGVTHIVAFVRNKNKLYPGDVVKVGLQMVRGRDALNSARADRHMYQYIDPVSLAAIWRYFGAGREVTANIWTVRPGTIRVSGGLVLLDRRAALNDLELEIVFCSNPGDALPISAAGYLGDNPYELAEGMFEVARHIDHYRATAREASQALRPFHNRAAFWDCFLGGKTHAIPGDKHYVSPERLAAAVAAAIAAK